MMNAEVPGEADQSQVQAKRKHVDRAGIGLFRGAELLDHGFGDGGDDFELVGVIQGGGDQNELRAVGKLDGDGAIAAGAHPGGLGPEL